MRGISRFLGIMLLLVNLVFAGFICFIGLSLVHSSSIASISGCHRIGFPIFLNCKCSFPVVLDNGISQICAFIIDGFADML